MIYKCGDINFKYSWLDYIVQDPVHPNITAYTRITGTRVIFVDAEGDEPQYIVSAKLGPGAARSMKDILMDHPLSKEAATFYSIFRVPGSANKGGGGEVLKRIIDYCKLHGTDEFFTLSPIPYLKTRYDELPGEEELRRYLTEKKGPVERFHLNNGASIANVNYLADESELRLEESWGAMINYRYA